MDFEIENGVLKKLQNNGNTEAESIVIPKDATRIGDRAFENHTSLKSIMIPDGVTEIGNCAFKNEV